MSTPLFGLDIAGMVQQEIGSGMPSIVLTKRTPAGRDETNPNKMKPDTETTHRGNGFRGEFEESAFMGTTVRRTDALIHVFAESLEGGVVPGKGDSIELGGETWKIEDIVGVDPAGAVYDCQCR